MSISIPNKQSSSRWDTFQFPLLSFSRTWYQLQFRCSSKISPGKLIIKAWRNSIWISKRRKRNSKTLSSMIWTSSTILNCKYCSWTHWATLIFRWWFQGLNKPILSPSKPITMKIWKYAKILSEQTTSNPCSRSRRTMSSSTQRKKRSRPRPSPRSKTEICSTTPSSDSSSKRKCCSNWWASSRTSSTFVPILHLSKDNTIWHFTQSIGC